MDYLLPASTGVIALAAMLYVTQSSGDSQLPGDAHKDTRLLHHLTLAALSLGCFVFWIGSRTRHSAEQPGQTT